MFKVEHYYLAAMTSCERMTDEIRENFNAITISVKLIEENFLRASEAIAVATGVGAAAHAFQPVSLPAAMLEKEALNLIFSLSELKSAVQARLSATLEHLNNILIDAIGANHIITDAEALKAYEDYREVLVKCISILERLDDELFETCNI